MNNPNTGTGLAGVIGCMALVLCLGTTALAQRRGPPGWGAGPVDESLFQGIDDERVLPMLKHLARTHGGMNVPAADGRFLYDLILEKGYKRGLEIGTSNGYSGLWIGLALKRNGGRLITIEIDPQAADEARENFKKAGLDDFIEVITADALKAIPQVTGELDFVFIDAHKPQYPDYLRLVRDKLKPGGTITAHNVTDNDRSMADFVAALRKDPGLETQIVNRHTMAVSRVRAE